MPALTANPGFVPILMALVVMALPRNLRAPAIVVSALLALWLLLDREFGAATAMAQMGLPVVLLNLDALNRIFGIALLIALIAVGIHSGGRRNRYEDAAILLLAGSVVSALFVGDLISFVAAAALAGLAAAWVVFASPVEGASRAGARLLIWFGLEGLLFLVGVALHLSGGAQGSVFTQQMEIRTVGGAFIFAALMIHIGAPFAHVWLKDAVGHASATGGGALSAFTTMLGVYALARLFPSEPILIWVGGAMMVLGAFYTAAEDDLRRAGAYAFTAQTGLCVALVGVGTPLALAAAEGHAFAAILSFLAFQLVSGAVLERLGSVRLSELTGVGQTMPISAFLLLGSGLAIAAAPAFALYATHAVALEAMAEWELRWLWALAWALPAVAFTGLTLRASLAAYTPPTQSRPINEAPFAMQLGGGLALFLCLAVGLAPRWLYNLMPADLIFDPFAIDRVTPHFELLGAAGVAYLSFRRFGVAPREQSLRLLDIDALYRGPLAASGRWAGVLALRVYGAWQDVTRRTSIAVARSLAAITSACDRPYARGSAAAAMLACAAGALLLMFLVH